jgi:hypothetical protein
MAVDFIINDDLDLAIKNGDFVLDESDAQEGRLIMLSTRGNWRQHPLLGIGVMRWINKAITASIERAIQKTVRLQFEYDDKKVQEISLETDTNNRLLNLIIKT